MERPVSSLATSRSVMVMPIMEMIRSSPSTRHESMPGIHEPMPPKSPATFQTWSAEASTSMAAVPDPMVFPHSFGGPWRSVAVRLSPAACGVTLMVGAVGRKTQR